MYLGIAKFVKNRGAHADPGDLDILKDFLDDGADPDERCIRMKKTALMWAVENCNQVLVRFMIQHGANVHLVDHNDHTPLMVASMKGCKEIVQVLIDAGSDVNKVWHDRFGRTALTCAAAYGHVEVVCLLIQYGADIEALDKAYGAHMTPLMLAVVYGHEATARTLIKMGAHPSIESPHDNGFFDRALLESAEMFKRILWHGKLERKKVHMGLLRTMPMMMLWRKRATERLYHPSRMNFGVNDIGPE